jgi:hypothetical protein
MSLEPVIIVGLLILMVFAPLLANIIIRVTLGEYPTDRRLDVLQREQDYIDKQRQSREKIWGDYGKQRLIEEGFLKDSETA